MPRVAALRLTALLKCIGILSILFVPMEPRTSEASLRYLQAIHDTLARIEMDKVRQAAELIAAALEEGGIIHLFGSGHSSLLAQEVFYRAGGLVAINPLLDPRLGFEQGAVESTEFEREAGHAAELLRAAGIRRDDIGIVISNSGRNALPVEVALQMKAAGMKIVALTNVAQSRGAASRHPSGKRLFEVADAVVDNHCPPGDAAVVIRGIANPLGPLSTIVGAAILHLIFIEATSALARKGKPPAVFRSANVGEGNLEHLRRAADPFRDRIRYYRPSGGNPSGA